MRVFAGIEFSTETKDGIAHVQQDLRMVCSKGRWKHTDNFHLTLKFIGEIEEHKTGIISRALAQSAREFMPFTLKADRLGCFGGKKGIRVLWLGLGGDTNKLIQLKRRIEDEMSVIGFDREQRGYSPHITMVQDIQTRFSLDDMRKYIDIETIPGVGVEEIVLFESRQSGRKRIYKPLRRFALSGDR